MKHQKRSCLRTEALRKRLLNSPFNIDKKALSKKPCQQNKENINHKFTPLHTRSKKLRHSKPLCKNNLYGLLKYKVMQKQAMQKRNKTRVKLTYNYVY